MAAQWLTAVAVALSRRPRLPGALMAGATIVIILLVAAALAQFIAPYPFNQMHIRNRSRPASLHYWAGTDEYGRDVFSRVLIGSQLSLLLGVIATLISLGIGVPLGMLAGYRRGLTDEVIMRILDIMMAYPPIMLVLLIIAITPPSLIKTAFAIGILSPAPQLAVSRAASRST